ncbi:MAG: hypothetical protein LBS58_04975 [Coriobacteriales bacterium]|jgi:hypothetical protein|nr:hypothetical protein [Coriobacteriales bacterium]
MGIKQLSVFIENHAGTVGRLTNVLDTVGIQIRGFSLADTVDYGIARIVVDKPQAAQEALEQAGFLVRLSDVLCIELPDTPGALGHVFTAVAKAGVDVQYAYSLVSTYVVLKVDDVRLAEGQLEGQPLRFVGQEELALPVVRGW